MSFHLHVFYSHLCRISLTYPEDIKDVVIDVYGRYECLDCTVSNYTVNSAFEGIWKEERFCLIVVL
jgi:hypothetical protein